MIDLTKVDKVLLTAIPAKEGNNVLTPLCQINFPQVFTPNAKDSKYDPEKYVITLRIPPEADITLLKQEAGRVATEEWGDKVKTVKPASPFKEIKEEGYEGWIMLRVKSKRKPTIVDPDIRDSSGKFIPILEDDGSLVYSGRWARVSINAFAYTEPNKGVSFSLNNIMLLHHDESLAGRVSAHSEFEAPVGYSSGAPATVVATNSNAVTPAKEVKTAADLF